MYYLWCLQGQPTFVFPCMFMASVFPDFIEYFIMTITREHIIQNILLCALTFPFSVKSICLVRSTNTSFLQQVSKVNVTFRDIIHQYRMQPQCKPSVFRNVFINLPPLRRAGVYIWDLGVILQRCTWFSNSCSCLVFEFT